MAEILALVSHKLCPYVQRVSIVLQEKGVAFERKDVDLSTPPDWFLQISPLGKTPVLLVNDEPIFESAVICEFLDETRSPRLHPDPPLERAKHRAYMEFGSSILDAIAAFYNAATDDLLEKHARDIKHKFSQMESVLGEGPFFMGKKFCVVDAVFGPVFRYFEVFDGIDDFGFFADFPKISAWRAHLQSRPSVQLAVRPDYPDLLRTFLVERNTALSRRVTAISDY
jgi:glutathione S-transferase